MTVYVIKILPISDLLRQQVYKECSVKITNPSLPRLMNLYMNNPIVLRSVELPVEARRMFEVYPPVRGVDSRVFRYIWCFFNVTQHLVKWYAFFWPEVISMWHSNW